MSFYVCHCVCFIICVLFALFSPLMLIVKAMLVCQGVCLTLARGECMSPRAGVKLSNTPPVGEWSKCCNTSEQIYS